MFLLSLLSLLSPASHPPPLESMLHWPPCSIGQAFRGSRSSGRLPEASIRNQQSTTNNQLAKMEISMDYPELISLSSISDSTDHSSNSNHSFCSSPILLSPADTNVRRTSRKGLGSTAPSKNKTKTDNNNNQNKSNTPAKLRLWSNDVKEVPPPVVVVDPIAGATVSNVVIGTKLVPVKCIDTKKKNKLTDANSSLLQFIAGVPPTDISVDVSKKILCEGINPRSSEQRWQRKVHPWHHQCKEES